MWTLISVGVMAIVARHLWIRLGRLEFQVELLKATIKRLRTEQAGAMDPAAPSAEAESEEPDTQASLPFGAPPKPTTDPVGPAETSIPPQQPVAGLLQAPRLPWIRNL